MRKKISFLVLGGTGSLLRQIAIPKSAIIGGIVLLLTLFSGIGYVLYDYVTIQQSLLEKIALERKISVQSEEINDQRKQIQSFASKINSFKAELEKLNDFEKRIRIIANLQNEDEQDGFFGIGGPMEEDLNTEIALGKNHSVLIRRMHKQVENLELAALNQEDHFETLLDVLEQQIKQMGSTPTIWPTKGFVTSTFGYRKSPFTGLRDFHKGLDIAAKTGTVVKATADGRVTFAGKKGFYGNLVVIDHGHGMVTRYGHLNALTVKRGDRVSRGDIVGKVGSTGRSTGSHLHYEVHLNGVPVNPQKYILN
ncbi:MAG: peptidoglycan DD-metalloendopeptidase family protein [Desulfobacterales bacterium]